MAYESLRTLFHKDSSNDRFERADSRAESRLNAESTFRLGFKTPAGELFLAMPRELSVLNEQVLTSERSISARLSCLPTLAQRATVRSLVIDEVVSTNELEGVYSTRRQINELLRSSRVTNSNADQRRFRELAKLYLGLTDATQTMPSTPADIRAIYDRVMDDEPLDEREQPDGLLFRKGGVEIIGPGSKVIHEGLYPEQSIIEAIERMLDLAASEDMPATLSAIVSHFLFEYAHPFYDGNGRTGRYLLALYLSRSLSTMTTLSLSRVIAENRSAYYRSFREAEHPLNHGELTLFVMNLLKNVRTAQEDLDLGLSEKTSLLDEAIERLDRFQTTHDLSDKEADIVYMLAQLYLFAAFPEATQDEVADFIRLGTQRSRAYAKRLEEKGIIITPSRRPLKFALSDSAARELGIAELT